MKLLRAILFCSCINLCYAINASAQFDDGRVYIEKRSARPAPEWLKTFDGISRGNAADIKTGADGNIYIAGNFNERAAFGKVSFYNARCNMFYLAKLDGNGQLQWACGTATGKGSTQCTNILFDAGGNVIVVGACVSNPVTLTSADGTGAIELRPHGTNPFIAWYSRDGKLLRAVMDDSTSIPVYAARDSKGNFYITGHVNTAPPHGGVNHTDICLAKYDKNGKNIWRKITRSEGNSTGSRVTVDKDGFIWLGGTLNGTTRFDSVTTVTISTTESTAIFIAKYNADGKLQHVISSFEAGRNATIQGLVTDVDGNIYAAGNYDVHLSFTDNNPNLPDIKGGYNIQNYILKVGADYKVKWMASITGNDFQGLEGMDIDKSGRLYISGYCKGAVFHSTGARVEELAGERDKIPPQNFFARYTTLGELDWVKSSPTKGAYSGSCIAVDADNIYIHGILDSPVNLPAPAIRSTTSEVVFVTKYSIARMNDTVAGAANIEKVAAAQEAANPTTSYECNCIATFPKRTGLPTMLSSLLNDEALARLAAMTGADAKALLNGRFYTDLQTSNVPAQQFYSFTLINYKPLLLQPNNAGPVINLSPCMDPATHHDEMKVTATIQHPILKFIPAFDEQQFDSSGLAYFKVFVALNNMSDTKLVEEIFKFFSNNYSPMQILGKINKHSGIHITVDDSSKMDGIATTIITEMRKKNIDAQKIIYEAFFRGNEKSKILTDGQSVALGNFFDGRMGIFSMKDIDNIIHTNASVIFNTPKASLDFPVALLHRCNPLTEEVIETAGHNYTPSNAVFDVKNVEYDSKEDVKIKFNSPSNNCFSMSEISGTGIIIHPIVFSPVFNYSDPGTKPQYANLQIDSEEYAMDEKKEKLLDNCTAINARISDVLLQYDGKKLRVTGKDIMIGGNFICGMILISGEPNGDKGVTVKQGDKTVKVNTEALQKQLKNMNLTDYYIINESRSSTSAEIDIYFLVMR